MKTLFSMFRMKLLTGLQYRAAAWAGVATQFFWGFMLIMIYEAFYRHTDARPAMELSQLCRYIWLQQSFFFLTGTSILDHDIRDLITSGGLAYELCRPVSLYGMWFARILGAKLAGTALRFLPVLLVASLLPAPYRMTLPPGPAHLILFLAALALAALLSTALVLFICVLTVRTLSVTGPAYVVFTLQTFFSGAVIAVPFMPRALQRLAYALPFRFLGDFPFRLYTGNIPLGEAVPTLALGIVWIAALTVLSRLLLRCFLRRVVIQGG